MTSGQPPSPRPAPDGMCYCCWDNGEETPAVADGLCAECIDECW